MRRSLTLEHGFGSEETTRRRKKQSDPSFKERRRNYMKRKICLKLLLLKDTLAVKRYGKGLLGIDKGGGSV